MLRPSIAWSDVANAARLAVFAHEAYGVNSSNPDGLWTWQNAQGLVDVHEDAIILAVAGTNDKYDVQHDLDLMQMDLTDWASIQGVSVDLDPGIIVPSGIAYYAGYAYHGIMAKLEELGVDLKKDYRPIWITGHSLGGAAAILLQMTTTFSRSTCVTFGAQRIFDDASIAPPRIRIAVRRATDPIIYVPPTYEHPQSTVYYVRYHGAVSKKLPWRYVPAAWCYEILSRVLSRRGLTGLGRGHWIGRYQADLWPLR